ncbi:MAG: DUF5717 family protein [Lachnospiraceae bacterium]
MREVIDSILEGNIEDEYAPLGFSVSKVELTMKRGENPAGTFRIFSGDRKYTHGYIMTTDSRMVCQTREFVGTDEEVSFEFHGEHLEEGEVVKGEFCVISNHGEFYLPFVVTVVHSVLDSSLGEIKNLFHFTNLARSAPGEATQLFYSKDFATVFKESDREYFGFYKGLSNSSGNVRNIEEFLISVNKKQKIDYIVKPGEIHLDGDHLESEYEISITKNGWGFTQLTTETCGDFVSVEKKIIEDDDFAGNVCRITFSIHPEYLHNGNNYGCIRLTGSYDEIEIPVTVNYHGVGNKGIYRAEKKRVLVELMELYQSFRMRKIGTNAWLRDSSKLTERMLAADEKDLRARLFKAQLLITERRINEARWILEHAERDLDEVAEPDAVAEAYYLYLTSLVRNEEDYIDMVTERVTALYNQNRNEWRIAWLLLYLCEDYSRSFSKKWMFIEEQFERGCVSPVFYAEAVLLLNANPSLLNKLGKFERRLLAYGAKKEALNADVCMQMVYLISREKNYSEGLFRTLTRCYKVHEENSILQEICSQLIKGNKCGREYLQWYKKGIEKELRITRLYEYYMMSAEKDSTPAYKAPALPKMVLMYFSYQNSLSSEQMAYLYANVYKNRDQFVGLYENFRGLMEQFVVKELLQRKADRNLTYLYQNVLDKSMMNEKCAEAFVELAFLYEIQCKKRDICRVIVYEPGMKEEKIYPVNEGRALISLPGTDYHIFLEDDKGNRYVNGVPYTLERLLEADDLLDYAITMIEDSHEVNMYCCFHGKDLNEVRADNEARFVSLYKDPGLIPFVKRKIGFKLLRYYFDQDKLLEMDALLAGMEPRGFTAKERDDVLKYMVLRGMENHAYDWIREYGPYGMDPKAVVKICSKLLEHEEFMQDNGIVNAVHYAFVHGKYEEKGLHYLSLHYEGLTKNMRDIWKAAKSFEVNVDELTERMVLQMLFTGAYVGEKMEIFKSYVETGRGRELVRAFITRCAYEYYVKDRLTDLYIFDQIALAYRLKEEVESVCKLAFVKHYAENPGEVTEECVEILTAFIRDLMKEGIVLKMFKAFPGIHDAFINSLSDRTVIEYRASEGARAVMHYRLGHGDGKEDEVYKTEEMKVSYGNIYFKEFVLFFGECLQYYIVEIKDGEEQVTESVTLQVSETSNVEGKYNAINDLSISYTMGDYETADRLLAEFSYTDYLQRGLFAIK